MKTSSSISDVRDPKTTIAVDRQAAKAAQQELGTSTLVDTVNAALREIAARGARRRFVERLSMRDGLELHDDDVMRSAWR
jgi:Arc/MetJ family transcription regulator